MGGCCRRPGRCLAVAVLTSVDDTIAQAAISLGNALTHTSAVIAAAARERDGATLDAWLPTHHLLLQVLQRLAYRPAL